jgi:raffinose/stachyose/melibiose transport system permease protein
MARRISAILIIAILIVQTYPVAWVFLTSLRPPQEFAGGNAFGWPAALTFENFARAFAQGTLGTYIRNSLIVTSVSIALIVILSMMVAYAIQIIGFRFSRVVLALFLAGIIVPVQVALVPLFITYSRLNFLDSYASIVVPMVGFAMPTSVYLFVSFYHFVPLETIEAAILDGCDAFAVFFRIVVPMSVNTIVTLVFVNSIFIWNDIIFANTFIFNPDLRTVPVGLQDYIGAMGATDWTATFAAVAVTITPVLLIFLTMNQAIIYGLESGATKG